MLWAMPASALDLACMSYRPFLNERALERPAVPDCLTRSDGFADALDHDACLGDLQQYQRDAQGYLNCLDSERGAAIAEFDQLLAGFRSRVGR